MEIKSFVFNAFEENTYVIHNKQESIIIDPGCVEPHEHAQLDNYLDSIGFAPTMILCTHCHIDHVLGAAYLKRKYQIPLWIPEGEGEVLKAVEIMAAHWGIHNYEPVEADELISQNDKIPLGNEMLEIRFAPGHSPGHFMYLHRDQKELIAGDVIFRESVGRADLPGGDFNTLEQSIRTQVYDLPEDVTIYPGHGPTTTVGYEMQNNPFVRPQ